MAISLTNYTIKPVKGMAAFSPNQPLINALISSNETATLEPGDVVTFDTASTLKDIIVVKKAAAADEPVGVVSYNAIASGFTAGDKITIFDTNAYCYMQAGAADITPGTNVTVGDNGQVVAAAAGNGVIGKAYTLSSAVGDLIIVKIKQDKLATA